ncbi:MAG: glycosyltransferase family 2 protein [Bacteroidales bacterium]|nr:glycosyltransferase family 2 protein [Bacteroidales bacterium]
MKKLSVVIITLNEEKHLRRCLDSVQDLADEILVVDSFSTDQTENICREYGVGFIQHPFEGYIEQKQYALDQASGPMILSLDADEALSDELRKSITHEKQLGFPFKAYTMRRLSNYCGKWIRYSGWYPDTKLRLFDKYQAFWGGSNPHDKVILNDRRTVVKTLHGNLLHFPYQTIHQHLAQINNFSEIKAKVAFANNEKSYWFHIVFASRFRFLKGFILKLGFLDGFYGYVISRNSAHASFLKYSKLRQLYRQQKLLS